MAHVTLPDIHELDGVIADYCDALFPEMKATVERELLIQRCVEPFTQLISMWESVHAHGSIEEIIWTTFVRDLSVMAESPVLAKKEVESDRKYIAARKREVKTGNYRQSLIKAMKVEEAQGNTLTNSNESWSCLFPQRIQIRSL